MPSPPYSLKKPIKLVHRKYSKFKEYIQDSPKSPSNLLQMEISDGKFNISFAADSVLEPHITHIR